MKKFYFMFIIFIFCVFLISGGNDIQEEVGFFMFMPNSSNQFVNEEYAFIKLDKLAQYLLNKNLVPGQILVNGYAAFAPNDIEPFELSRERALFVINELQKRGVSKELFSEPAGHGAVRLWSSKSEEYDRKLNRRVNILLISESPVTNTGEKPVIPVDTKTRSSLNFPFWIIFPLVVFIIPLLHLLKEKYGRKTHKNTKKKTASSYSAASYTVSLDEQIRSRAYEISQQRKEQGDFRDQDWYNATREISALYKVRSHSVFFDSGSWWAHRLYSN